ncbi:TonB-dependent receptor plug domain-containing protein [Aestuariicella hydrocarbonica]|uniref:TonB-dependent receptor plug domain-containing protein n=1 Tax=Pseudomaricurvus hydrocarbonicus TaxID=1470433 RepID=A0A9E5MMR5_9GAMM|nr:TonB-dependent receptor [Aestuariicella hydrocarbonica]NHO67090.1 TonB-dependent receptor plug domain-containing protein [Aestuariicella hydrocarbonica]
MHNKNKYARQKQHLLLMAVIAVNMGLPTYAVAAPTLTMEEIIVSARRKDESVQDVPLTVNGVTGQKIADLNIRKLEDLQSVVPGLTMEEDTISPAASMRGIRFDSFANVPLSVEFYMNEAHAGQLTVMQNVFDIERVEVLRGPQGTLRGKASPSGSISVTTVTPISDAFSGYVDITATNNSGKNVQSAINIPLIEDRLAIRFAGFWEENNINDVSSVFGHGDSEYRGDGYRISLSFTPTESLSFDLMYQQVQPGREIFFPVESAYLKNSSLPVSAIDIKASDRRSIQDTPEIAEQDLRMTVFNARWDINDYAQLNYVGSYNSDLVERTTPIDVTNAVDESYPDAFQRVDQDLYTDADGYNHEIRLQSIEPLFDRLDYVIGYLKSHSDTNVSYSAPQLIYLPGLFEGTFLTNISNQNNGKPSPSDEESVFVNLTYHFTEDTEVSVGARQIDWESTDYLAITNLGTILTDGKRSEDETVYTASFKHNFSESLMVYTSWGTSWRYGANAIGNLSTMQSDLEKSFLLLPPETSESFEVGFKSTLLNEKLRLNIAAYHQTFDDYPLRNSAGVYFQEFDASGNPKVGRFNFVSPVPVEVNGFELETIWLPTDSLSTGIMLSYSKGEVQDAYAACNDYLPQDGIPDTSGTVPTLSDVQAAAGSDNLTTCKTSERTDYAPLWTATLSSEYLFPVVGMDGYVRGLWTFYDESENDPSNPLDDVGAYDILNVYAGLKDGNGRWEVMLFVKNVLDKEVVTSRDRTPGSQNFTGVPAAVSDYRQVTLNAPQEMGVNLKYNF